MLCYITCVLMLYNINYVITCVMLCSTTCVMFCYKTWVMLCYIT